MEDFLDQWMLTCCAAVAIVTMQGLCMGLRMLRPRAAAHLRHFLTAGGTPRTIDLHRWLAADVGTRASLFSQIREQHSFGATSGRIAVPQVMHADGDWRWAMGSVVFDWQIAGDGIRITCRDRYHFQARVNRMSRPLHRLAAWLESIGVAASFDMVGETRLPACAIMCESASPRRYTKLYL